jgi:hypothetical protein
MPEQLVQLVAPDVLMLGLHAQLSCPIQLYLLTGQAVYPIHCSCQVATVCPYCMAGQRHRYSLTSSPTHMLLLISPRLHWPDLSSQHWSP